MASCTTPSTTAGTSADKVGPSGRSALNVGITTEIIGADYSGSPLRGNRRKDSAMPASLMFLICSYAVPILRA